MFTVINLIFSSVINFFRLIFSGLLYLRKDRIDKVYGVKGKSNYSIFRETISGKDFNKEEVVLIVGFRLIIIRSYPLFHWLFERLCILTTPFWSGFPGFRVKLWMVDRKTKNYLGIYKWQGRDNAKVYAEALVKILNLVSTKGSIWYEIKNVTFDSYLNKVMS